MSVDADHLASTLVARCSLARRLPVKAMRKYLAVLDATGEVSLVALLASKTTGGAIFAPPILISLIIFVLPRIRLAFFLKFWLLSDSFKADG
jgi:hypothetical protein